ncbi:LysR family transcriptional regulator [Paraburkholderia unamae]|uniref:LysR family transcriptional regulator n=1 Tax=Paraburkholderia unamae TaxID=219649 RepID=UPI000DC3348E|nr:LysR family transcriptional regulator [Paraburkholderia unamae]RAR54550.1 LysR family transcriptional regulator [Paraburkholderia unamae]
MNLRQIDLNRLVALREVLLERHVTRAAEKLGITQPAMSASLARMREVFQDPLLVRTGGGLSLTRRAEMVLENLDRVFLQIDNLLSTPGHFDPAESHRAFTIIGTDFVEQILLPEVITPLAIVAPNATIVSRPPLQRFDALMGEGEIDLAIGCIPSAAPSLYTRLLLTERYMCISRDGHSGVRGDFLSLDEYITLPHAQVFPFDKDMYSSPIEQALQAKGLRRSVALRQSSFVPLLSVVANSNLIATVPERLARFGERILPLRVHRPPLDIAPIPISLYWHARTHDDEGHKWFRDFLVTHYRSKESR